MLVSMMFTNWGKIADSALSDSSSDLGNPVRLKYAFQVHLYWRSCAWAAAFTTVR